MRVQPLLVKADSVKSIIWGVLLIVFGLVVMVTPALTSLAVTIVIAWALMGVGIAHLLSSWHAETFARALGAIAVGIVYFLAGLALQQHPLWADVTLTMVLAAVFIAEGAGGLAVAFFDHDHASGHLVGAVITLLLGVMIWNQLPSSALWAIGTLVGINLLIAGTGYLVDEIVQRQKRLAL
jgi:uncharacterized membrane protein HdeD (DUF308 family)